MQFESNYASELFDQFLTANTMRTVVTNFKRICNFLEIEPTNFDTFYPSLKKGISNNWRAQSIFNKLDKKSSNKIYLNDQKHEILKGQNCLIIGGGPCGLRTAIELQLLGADHVMVVEKRDRISRNNVVHLWPFVIYDLKELAGKKLHPKFCPSSIDHISIRQLQLMLLKISLIIGCDYIDNVEFKEICPLSLQADHKKKTNEQITNNEKCCCDSHLNETNEKNDQIGAYAHFKFNSSSNYPEIIDKLSKYYFNILIGADGRRNLLSSLFPRKEFRGKLAVAITANFINHHSLAEAQVPEISGISFIYYQQLFKSLYEQTNIDLENICYYKDDTHYLVMTAKKASLLTRGVLIEDFQDARALLSPENINQTELLNYAKDAAHWITGLDNLKFALNHYGTADVAMFDFTSMYAAENSCRVKEIYLKTKCCKQTNTKMNSVKNGLLLTGLVGDSLLEPFWPLGSGIGRGFLSSMDAAWLARQFAIKYLNYNKTNSIKENEENILSVISERESIYRLLAQTKSENLNQNFNQYTLNPNTRYPNLNSFTIMPNQCKHLLYSNLNKTIQNKIQSRQTLTEKRSPEGKANIPSMIQRYSNMAKSKISFNKAITLIINESIKRPKEIASINAEDHNSIRRITIACTRDTFKQQQEFTDDKRNQIEIEESPEDEDSSGHGNENGRSINSHIINNLNNKSNSNNNKLTGIEYLTNNQKYMTPSAFNLASIEKNRNKEIENVIKHRKEKLHQESLSSEERFMNHIRKQTKPKANWFLNAKTENSYESNTSSNRSNNSSIEDLPNHYTNHFTSKVRDLEFKLNSHNTFNEERYLKNQNSNRHVEGINVLMARLTLQNLLDPIKQEAKFKEEVKRKAFLEKDYKFVGKLAKDDWNVKLFNGNQNEENDKDKLIVDRSTNPLKPRPKERIAIFKEKLQNIESILTNGRTKVDDEVNRIVNNSKKQARSSEWIEKLKSELSDKQSNTQKKQMNKKQFSRKRSSFDQTEDTNHSVTNNQTINYLNKNPNVQYIKYEKMNKPIVTSKNENKFQNLERLKSDKIDKDKFDKEFEQQFKNNHQITYAKDNCARCHGKVMTVDKLNISGTLFHRYCLYCSNCGVNLRLSEIRNSNNVIDDNNCICKICSNENRLLTRSNSTSNYSTRLKERIKWKEMFLLNLDNQDAQQNKINERVEYENASFCQELLDDEEVTKLLNLDSNKDNCSKSSQSSDLLVDEEEENESDEEDESSTSESDTTGADINSDQFDVSEIESPKNNKISKKMVPEIILNEDDLELKTENLSDSENEQTLNNTLNQTSSTLNQQAKNPLSNSTPNTTPNTSSTNTLNNKTDQIIPMIEKSIPEKSKTISDISEVDEFDDLTDNSNRNSFKNSLKNNDQEKIDSYQNKDEEMKADKIETKNLNDNKPMSSFKVEIPKLLTSERYSKIPVLKDRVLNESIDKPIYAGAFTEKVLKSRSSPSLNDQLNFSSFYSTSSFK